MKTSVLKKWLNLCLNFDIFMQKKSKYMRTSIEINDQLIQQALELSQLKTKKEVVNEALEQFVKKMKRLRMLELHGKVEWEGNLDEMRSI
ncbi:type II toxin-antitoxin system VapB family antitoxin [Phaeodactylibacter sp.]|nr:type II toxin-antitoxin system VapB family antitoxin [Phaeodactylibacter sp.]MCI4646951.1 type II toxin-antitoxin system VapB family antitoxin [Phaeodactylibacter sp.]MCI5093441.1 type II toxin-antitoxin system VapB family antitoxin [Phaeodactylibacter sp.]